MYEISVIIPFYKSEKYIGDCLKSIIYSKIFEKCEVILIDDGSPDASGKIVKGISNKYNNIRVYHYDNCGLSAARNRGLEKASGKYVFFIDSDDFMKRDYLSELYLTAEKTQSDIIFAGFSEVKENGDFVRQVERRILRLNKVMSGYSFLNLRMDYGDWCNQVWCALYRKDFLVRNDLLFDTQIKLYEDILFTNKCLILAERVYAIPTYGYMYRFHQDSMVHGNVSEQDIVSGLAVLKKLIEFYCNLNKNQKKIFGRVFFEHISMLLYYIGRVDPEDKKIFYKILSSQEIMKILGNSITTFKEAVKYFIFKYWMDLYYFLVKKKDGS